MTLPSPDTRARRILDTFAEYGALTSWEVAAAEGITVKLATSHISKLRQRELLRRVRETDRRPPGRGRNLIEYEMMS